MLIIAGAGSGKTRMITYRIAHMLEQGIPQSHILALTFTNKAAAEMAERVRDLTRAKLPKLTTSTFHAFGVMVLRAEISHLGYDNNFTIYDQADIMALIKNVVRELKIPLEEVDLYELNNLFSSIKTKRSVWTAETSQYREIYDEYLLHLKAYNAVDFDDLIMLPLRLFEEHPAVLEKYRSRFNYIMVDEFQDTSHAQYKMVLLLASEHRNICVVGDDDQSIYSWRGADYENLVNFERDFPEVTEIKLEQNYRSTGNILHAANSLIANNTNGRRRICGPGPSTAGPSYCTILRMMSRRHSSSAPRSRSSASRTGSPMSISVSSCEPTVCSLPSSRPSFRSRYPTPSPVDRASSPVRRSRM